MKILLFIFLFHSSWVFAIDCGEGKLLKEFTPKYTQKFKISYYDRYKIVSVGEDKNKDSFIMAENKPDCQTRLTFIQIPVKRFVATSTTYLPALKILGKEKSLIGFQGINYISSPDLRRQKIKNINFQLNPEELKVLRPDLVMAYQGNIPPWKTVSDFRKLDIPLVLNWDLLENHPLARAEWLIYTASFFNLENQGISAFLKIENEYLKVKSLAEKLPRKTVLIGELKNGRWTSPGGRSDLARIIKDAGGDLALDNASEGTQSIAFEKVLQSMSRIDIWLPHNEWKEVNQITSNPRYNKLLQLKIYNNTRKLNPDGFNDYWEEGLARPDLLIKDIFWVIHPEKNQQHVPIWYKILK